MLIDCDTCQVRGAACRDCVVTVLLGPPAELGSAAVELDEIEQAAVQALAEGGLIPPLRLVPIVTHGEPNATTGNNRSAGLHDRKPLADKKSTDLGLALSRRGHDAVG